MDRHQSSLLSNCSVTRSPVARRGLASHHGRTGASPVKGSNRSLRAAAGSRGDLGVHGSNQRRPMRLSSLRAATLLTFAFN